MREVVSVMTFRVTRGAVLQMKSFFMVVVALSVSRLEGSSVAFPSVSTKFRVTLSALSVVMVSVSMVLWCRFMKQVYIIMTAIMRWLRLTRFGLILEKPAP